MRHRPHWPLAILLTAALCACTSEETVVIPAEPADDGEAMMDPMPDESEDPGEAPVEVDPVTPDDPTDPHEPSPEEPTDPVDPPEEDPVDPPAEEDPPEEDDDDDIIDPTGAPNEGWIGGACDSAADCDFDEATCLSDAEGHPDGQCTLACDGICPDRDGANSITFCTSGAMGGQCMSRCDFDLFPQTGCRSGYECKVKRRHGEPDTQVATCVPPQDMDVVEVSACLDGLTQKGIGWSSWAYDPQNPSGQPSLTCTVEDPIRVDPVINGVTYRYYNQSSGSPMYASCALAEALWDLGEVLKTHDITEVLHIGTFNCRTIGSTSRLSQHGLANAIDIWGFVDADGQEYVLEDHWEHDTGSPQAHKARVMYEIGQAMHAQGIFHNVLTPNYDAAHDNHFHVDLAPGANFIGATSWSEPYFGASEQKWQERCGIDHGHDH